MVVRKAYDLKDSPFFRLRTKVKLAKLLFISPKKLERLANGEDRYHDFKKEKKSGGFRDISAPHLPLKIAQKRIATLLARIAPPEYLFAPVAGRSYVGNAARHIGAQAVHLLDIEDFFPSCTLNKVAWFFGQKLECSPDVTALLCKIVTRNGSLPQGSPCSPILAYLSYMDMWAEIDEQVQSSGCRLSVYADDLTISGKLVHEATVWRIKQTLFRHGHRHSIEKEHSCRGGATEITGVILRKEGVASPNRQHHRIHEIRDDIRNAQPEEAIKLRRKLSGRLAQMAQIAAGNAVSGSLD